MSLSAIGWALEQFIKPSSTKFVLVVLADSANQDGKVWNSVETLCRKTCQDRKTVIDSIDRLEEMGLLLDTGERKGKTGLVKVYRLNGLETGERHYVYRVLRPDTGEYYIGVRSAWARVPDDKYLGSGVWPMAMQAQGVRLVKDVLAEFKDRKSAEAYESSAIRSVFDDPLCKNDKNGTVPKEEQFRIPPITVPLFPDNSSENGTQNRKVTIKDPSVKGDGYTDEFETAFKTLPKRAGSNPKKDAFKHWQARIREGATPEAMIAGAERYAAFIRATGKEGTEYVLTGATFFGPSKRYEEEFAPPPPPKKPVQPAQPTDWWSAPAGVMAKAAEVGIERGDDEDYLEFKCRLFAQLGDGPWINSRNATEARLIEAYRAAA
jgi:hypothetical protein